MAKYFKNILFALPLKREVLFAAQTQIKCSFKVIKRRYIFLFLFQFPHSLMRSTQDVKIHDCHNCIDSWCSMLDAHLAFHIDAGCTLFISNQLKHDKWQRAKEIYWHFDRQYCCQCDLNGRYWYRPIIEGEWEKANASGTKTLSGF